jgi:hypothetical protein
LVTRLSFHRYESLNVHTIKSSVFKGYLESGHIFYSFNCTIDSLIYNNGSDCIPFGGFINLDKLISQAQAVFGYHFGKALRFKMIADQLKTIDDCGFILYLLQQAIELVFRGAVFALYGKDMKSHSIRTLKKNNQLCLPGLNNLLPETEIDGLQMLTLIEEAYLNGRYAPDLHVTPSQLQFASDKANEIHRQVPDLFSTRINELRKIALGQVPLSE